MFDDNILERNERLHQGVDSPPSAREADNSGSSRDQRDNLVRMPSPAAKAPVPPAQPEAPASETAGGARKGSFLRRRPLISAIGALLLAAAFGGGYLYVDNSGHYESTDDAFIAARQSALAPKVSGYITAVEVNDNEHVTSGQTIARLDDRDYRVALAQAEAQIAAARASIENIDAQTEVQQAQIAANQAQVDQAQAALVFAQQQAARFQHLEQTGYGTVQNSEQYTSQLHQQQAALQSAQATLNLAQRQVESLKAQRKSAVASLAQAEAQRDQAQLNLSYTNVTAAQPGRVVNLSAAVGQFAQPGTNLTMFVPDQIWVTANFKEIQLDKMRPGEQGDLEDRRLSGPHHPGPCRQRPAGLRHRVLAAAGAERHRQLRQDRAARAGQDRHGQSADRRRARPGHVGGADGADRFQAVADRTFGERAMSAAATETNGFAVPAVANAATNPWLIAVVVALASFMEVLDTTIANVALPYIAGGMGVSEDEASWVVTTYLVSNAIILTASSFLARTFGRKTFFLICLGAVHGKLGRVRLRLEPERAAAVSHPAGPRRRRHGAGGAIDPGRCVSAGQARPGLRGFRRRRGGGAGGRPDARRLAVGQSVVALVFPDQRPGRPVRDGADRDRAASARDCAGRSDETQQGKGFDFIGFMLVATFLGALEMVLDRGLEDDWFGSSFIVTFAVICGLPSC